MLVALTVLAYEPSGSRTVFTCSLSITCGAAAPAPDAGSEGTATVAPAWATSVVISNEVASCPPQAARLSPSIPSFTQDIHLPWLTTHLPPAGQDRCAPAPAPRIRSFPRSSLLQLIL